jgi:hypothetical protein
VVSGLKSSIPPRRAMQMSFALLLLLSATSGMSQKAQDSGKGNLPAYDTHTEMKTKGVVDEINVLPLGSNKDLVELIIKSGNDKVDLYVCPKTFQEEMGISFSKGDEVAVTGSKVKLETGDVILVRELIKGADTLVFRDDKGAPVWNLRTGK